MIYLNVPPGLKANCKLLKLSLSNLTNLVYMVYKAFFHQILGGFILKKINPPIAEAYL